MNAWMRKVIEAIKRIVTHPAGRTFNRHILTMETWGPDSKRGNLKFISEQIDELLERRVLIEEPGGWFKLDWEEFQTQIEIFNENP